jgi:hypothetical protein
MFNSEELKDHLEQSATIQTQSAIIAEWNMNIPTNIFKIGNYRYRPTQAESKYRLPLATFDPADSGNYYTNATDADIKIDGGIDDEELPTLLTVKKDKIKTLYSLEDCFKRFRPRSGINKASFFAKNHIHHSNMSMFNRPR